MGLEFEARLECTARHCLKKEKQYCPSCCKEYGLEGKCALVAFYRVILKTQLNGGWEERMNRRSNIKGIWQAFGIGIMRKEKEPCGIFLPTGWVDVLNVSLGVGMREETGVQDKKGKRILCLVSEV